MEEVVVTASRVEAKPPAQQVLRQADFLLLKVLIHNDARELKQRKQEIHATLLTAIKQAKRVKEIELSSVNQGGFVQPLNASNYKIDLRAGKRPDTSQSQFRVKARLSDSSESAEKILASLKAFVDDLKMTGRTLVEADGEVEVSIVNPNQYRTQIIKLMADDVKKVTSSLGEDYRVVLQGIDSPVKWVRVGSTDVSLFVPYTYVVIPTSLEALNLFPEY